MTNKERTKAIKEALKNAGYNTKDFSIRSRDCGYSDATDITVKNLSIKINDVRRIVKSFESIRYDEYSGEILEGCNTYISVQYDHTIKYAAMRENEPEVQDLLDGMEATAKEKGYADLVIGEVRVYVNNGVWNLTEILHPHCERPIIWDCKKADIFNWLPSFYTMAKAQGLI